MSDTKYADARTVRELTGFKGPACLVEAGGEFFVVSSVNALYTGPETLVFPATAEGKVTSWCEVAGDRGVSREEAIASLAEHGPREDLD